MPDVGLGETLSNSKKLGYRITAFDASRELVERASQLTGLQVQLLKFSRMAFDSKFDGIWACASLLHVPRLEIEDILYRCKRALKPGGCFFLSFKYGDQDLVKGERLFSSYTEKSFEQLLGQIDGLSFDSAWVTHDIRPERHGDMWLNALAFKNLSSP